ncbi:hypothetical protein GCM10007940_36350 [Portibacter lacus]|uniref:Sulfotransferase domain-containing protein n=2 Tax=Portibacter lacus TaxID=1099794 RepID=A0AA37WH67_9BACT|nr:hypothetical protein GCM10007940_36350 [Portibacter lacus]
MISSLKLHPNWSYPFKKFEIPDQPFNDIYKTHCDFLTALETVAEQLLAFWCLSNQETRNMVEVEKSFQVIFYENSVTNPERELKVLFEKWGIAFSPKYLNEISNSSASSIDNKKMNPKSQLFKWKKLLGSEEINRYQSILN